MSVPRDNAVVFSNPRNDDLVRTFKINCIDYMATPNESPKYYYHYTSCLHIFIWLFQEIQFLFRPQFTVCHLLSRAPRNNCQSILIKTVWRPYKYVYVSQSFSDSDHDKKLSLLSILRLQSIWRFYVNANLSILRLRLLEFIDTTETILQ